MRFKIEHKFYVNLKLKRTNNFIIRQNKIMFIFKLTTKLLVVGRIEKKNHLLGNGCKTFENWYLIK